MTQAHVNAVLRAYARRAADRRYKARAILRDAAKVRYETFARYRVLP